MTYLSDLHCLLRSHFHHSILNAYNCMWSLFVCAMEHFPTRPRLCRLSTTLWWCYNRRFRLWKPSYRSRWLSKINQIWWLLISNHAMHTLRWYSADKTTLLPHLTYSVAYWEAISRPGNLGPPPYNNHTCFNYRETLIYQIFISPFKWNSWSTIAREEELHNGQHEIVRTYRTRYSWN